MKFYLSQSGDWNEQNFNIDLLNFVHAAMYVKQSNSHSVQLQANIDEWNHVKRA